MDKIKNIIYDVLPCWYELSWREILSPSIILRVHKDFIGEIKERKIDFENAPIIMGLKMEFGFENFIGNFDKDFGFDGAFMRKGETGGFVEFVIPIPKVKKEGGQCNSCGGSGENEELLHGECLTCSGSGKKYAYDWKTAYGISASLNVFFTLASFPEKETQAEFPQLMTISVATRKGMYGGSLSGECSIPFAKWAEKFYCGERNFAPEVLEAMESSYHHMFGLSDFDINIFQAYMSNGFLYTSCPGDACGLHATSQRLQKNEGYKFSCHNVDTPMQQITLLAGLAALHDKARKEMK
jgi:hypothetical protein